MAPETPASTPAPAQRSAPRAPANLDAAGRKLWRDLTRKYDFDTWEVPLVEAACRQADAVAALEEHVREHGIETKGSTGQTRLSPMVTEARLGRRTLGSMLADLRLPEDPDLTGAGEKRGDVVRLPRPRTGKSRQAQAAANRRWQLDRDRKAARGEQRRRAEAERRAQRLEEPS